MGTASLQWAEDRAASREGHFITKCSGCGVTLERCRCMGPHEIRYGRCERCSSKRGVRTAPSEPYLTDEYEPTDAKLWQRCLEVVKGERPEFTQSDRTIHAPNDGRGYLHMPNPKAMAWAVKQYNGFGGGWKGKQGAHQAELRILAQGGVVVARKGELDDLGRRGLARVAGEAHGRVYWDITAKGQKVARAGLVDDLDRRITALLRNFDAADAKALGEWLNDNFRVSSPKTPRGGKAVKDRLQRLVWVLKFRHSSSANPDPKAIVQEIQKDWDEVSKDAGLLLKFTDEGGTVVPKSLVLDGVTYVNEAGVPAPQLEKYAQRLSVAIKGIQGWRKALAGGLVVKLKPPSAFNGSVSGKYKREEDSLWVRTTPAILRRGAGYASFEYIIVHELGHRWEAHHKVPQDFDRPDWWTTSYSRDEGEAFAELFALGHFGIKGTWDAEIVDRFERLMTGKAEG